jgi:hypothetical protein
MSNPGDAATQGKTEDKKSTVTFAEQVNTALKNVTTDEKGSLVFPEDVSDEVKFAAISEKRYRDTQAAYTRTAQKTKALEAENSVLLQKATSKVDLKLTEAQTEELETLKFEDPEAWRRKMNSYEAEAREKYRSELTAEVKNVSSSSLEKDELKRREQVLAEFMEQNEGFKLDDDMIKNDIPPRITKKLDSGDITFEEFLEQCHEYVNTGKVIAQEKVPNNPNLSKIGGRGSPDKHAVKEDMITSYNKETF